MKSVAVLLLLLVDSCYALSMINDEPKYTTQDYIQSHCVLEYCPLHINDKAFKKQGIPPAWACYESCCKQFGGCNN